MVICEFLKNLEAVSGETKNLNETETETFFRYQNFSIPNPILFSIPKFSETDTDTFFDTKNFRNRYRYFFRNLFFPKPIPILITIPFFQYRSSSSTSKLSSLFSNKHRHPLIFLRGFPDWQKQAPPPLDIF